MHYNLNIMIKFVISVTWIFFDQVKLIFRSFSMYVCCKFTDEIEYPTLGDNASPKQAIAPIIPSVDRGLKPSIPALPVISPTPVVPESEPAFVKVESPSELPPTSPEVSTLPSTIPAVNRATKQLAVERCVILTTICH